MSGVPIFECWTCGADLRDHERPDATFFWCGEKCYRKHKMKERIRWEKWFKKNPFPWENGSEDVPFPEEAGSFLRKLEEKKKKKKEALPSFLSSTPPTQRTKKPKSG